jgi:transcriptional regulator with XRE-family HTH domain
MQVITSWTGGQADALRQALRMTNESFAEYLGVAARTVAYWRKNPEITPTLKMQEILDAALDRATDRAKAQFGALIGRAEHGKLPDPVESIELPGRSLLGASPGTDPEFGDSEYLQSIRKHIREIVALDNRFGGADLVRLSTRFFRTLHEQLGTGTYDLSLERDLQSAAAELAEVVGWLAFDSEEHDLARRMNQESLYFARLAGDKIIELLTLQNSSMHAASQGRPKEALQIARSVLDGDYRLSPRLKALFLTRKARALAQGGDDSALRLFPEIRSLYHEGVSDDDPAWEWWIDERELTWHEAMVQRDLGMPERAIAQFERSVIATPLTEIRSQYLHRAYLLQAQVDNATWDDAEQSIRHLLPLSTEVASTRTVVLLRNVTSRLAAHPRAPLALQEQVTLLNSALDQAPV